MKTAARSILVLDVSPFSRSLWLLPSMRALRAAYPQSFIKVAATKGVCELLDASGLADETIDLGVITAADSGLGSSLKRVGRLARRARKNDADLVIDFSPRLETQLLSRFVLGAETAVPSRLAGVIETLLGGRWRGKQAIPSDYASYLSRMGIQLDDPRLAITLPAQENDQFEKLLSKKGSRGGEPIIILHSSDAGQADRWPAESFADLAARLRHNFGARIVAIDDPYEKSFTEALGKLLPEGAIKVSEPRSLAVAAAVARASLVVMDQKGVAMMASDFSTPVVEITDSPEYAGTGEPRQTVRAAAIARVEVDEVFKAACELMRNCRSSTLFQR
jgi:ADP-heptose:LPS heptosyltransferase